MRVAHGQGLSFEREIIGLLAQRSCGTDYYRFSLGKKCDGSIIKSKMRFHEGRGRQCKPLTENGLINAIYQGEGEDRTHIAQTDILENIYVL